MHSGFVIGRLARELVNLSNERSSITIKREDHLIHIEFLCREGEPSPHMDRYMFQFMNDKETDTCGRMLSENSPVQFPSEKLEQKKKERLGRED